MSRRSPPLAGRVVLVTRSRDRAAELSDRLRDRGAEVLEAPTIRIESADNGPLDDAIRGSERGSFAWVVFTSAVGVAAWVERSRALQAKNLKAAKLAAVGEGTAVSLKRAGFSVDVMPNPFTTSALAEAFPEGSGRVLLARADIASGDLDDAIRRKGWDVVRVDAYRVLEEEELPDGAVDALAAGAIDAITLTSASTVRGLVRVAGVVRGPAIVCIGPVTADAARAEGFVVHAVAEPHTIGGLVDAVERALKTNR